MEPVPVKTQLTVMAVLTGAAMVLTACGDEAEDADEIDLAQITEGPPINTELTGTFA